MKASHDCLDPKIAKPIAFRNLDEHTWKELQDENLKKKKKEKKKKRKENKKGKEEFC